MAFLRAQSRQLLCRLQALCTSADAAVAGTASQTCTTLAAADGHTLMSMVAESAHHLFDDRGNSRASSCEHVVRDAAGVRAAADSLLLTPHGIHSLRPAIAAVVLQPSAPGISAMALVQQQMLHHPERLDDAAGIPASSEDQPAHPAMSLVKRTYQPSVIVRKRRHGFLSRLRSKGGQRVLERRRLKGRWKKSA